MVGLPLRLAPERPRDPGLVVALDDRVGVEGTPAVDDAVVAAALDEKGPKVAGLVIAERGAAVRRPEKRPGEVFVHEVGIALAGVKREEADLAGGRGAGRGVRGGLDRVVPDERPERIAALKLAGPVAPAEKRPEGEALLRAACEAQERPGGQHGVGAALVDFGVEREGRPGDAVVAEEILDRAGDRQQAVVGSRRVTGLAREVEGPNGELLRVGRAELGRRAGLEAGAVDEVKDAPGVGFVIGAVEEQRIERCGLGDLAGGVGPLQVERSEARGAPPAGQAFLKEKRPQTGGRRGLPSGVDLLDGQRPRVALLGPDRRGPAGGEAEAGEEERAVVHG